MNLKSFRQKLGISQRELSEKLEIPITTLFSYEQGTCRPSIDALIKIADFYNVSLDELVGRDSDTVNLKFLDENEAYLIKKILKMNQLELSKTRAYITGLLEE